MMCSYVCAYGCWRVARKCVMCMLHVCDVWFCRRLKIMVSRSKPTSHVCITHAHHYHHDVCPSREQWRMHRTHYQQVRSEMCRFMRALAIRSVSMCTVHVFLHISRACPDVPSRPCSSCMLDFFRTIPVRDPHVRHYHTRREHEWDARFGVATDSGKW